MRFFLIIESANLNLKLVFMQIAFMQKKRLKRLPIKIVGADLGKDDFREFITRQYKLNAEISGLFVFKNERKKKKKIRCRLRLRSADGERC